MQSGAPVEATMQADGPAALRLFRPKDPHVALGMAVEHLMLAPVFACLRFGDWSRVLVGQINRGHYCFAIDESKCIQGFLGWALTTTDRAEAWLAGSAGLSSEDGRAGDCLIINAWSARSPKASRLLRDAARSIGRGKQAIYFKRHYKDGSIRATRIEVGAFAEPDLVCKSEGAD